jgi:Bacterial regulatory proteins, luxR family
MAIERISNREIAQPLFVTVKTIDAHMNHVFQKLDIDSMKELAGHGPSRQGHPAKLRWPAFRLHFIRSEHLPAPRQHACLGRSALLWAHAWRTLASPGRSGSDAIPAGRIPRGRVLPIAA